MRTTLLLLSLFLLGSCEKLFTWDKFVLPKTQYNGTQLRVDGYYYMSEDGIYRRTYCFYRNGCLLEMGSSSKTSLKETDAHIKREYLDRNDHSSQKEYWGLFVIEDNTIRFEHYIMNQGLRKEAYIWEGTILNDSTFHITSSHRSNGSDRTERNEMYHFRQFSPKPDSTNNFIK